MEPEMKNEILQAIGKLSEQVKGTNEKVDNLDKKFTGKFNELDGKFNKLDEKFTGKFNELDEKFTGKFNELDKKFTGKFNELDEKFTGKFNELDEKFTGKFNEHDVNIKGLDQKFNELKETVDSINRTVVLLESDSKRKLEILYEVFPEYVRKTNNNEKVSQKNKERIEVLEEVLRKELIKAKKVANN